jgi:hypothetical protein
VTVADGGLVGSEARDGSAFAAAPSSLRFKVPRFDDGARDGQHGTRTPHSTFTCLLNLSPYCSFLPHKGEDALSDSTRRARIVQANTRSLKPHMLAASPANATTRAAACGSAPRPGMVYRLQQTVCRVCTRADG